MSDVGSDRKRTAHSLVKAVLAIASSIFLMVLNLSGSVFFALLFGFVILVAGLVIVRYFPDDKIVGIGVILAGILTILSALPFLTAVTSFLLWIGGLVLLLIGLFCLFQFYYGFRSLN